MPRSIRVTIETLAVIGGVALAITAFVGHRWLFVAAWTLFVASRVDALVRLRRRTRVASGY